MRGNNTFIAVRFDEQQKAKLAEWAELIKARLPAEVVEQVRWVPAANYHLTLFFLGKISAAQVEAIQASMDVWFSEGMSAFEAEALQVVTFPSLTKPRHLVVKFDCTLLLQYLQNEVWTHLKTLGFDKPSQRFIPHITLGHFSKSVQSVLLDWQMDLVEHIDSEHRFIDMNSICLFESVQQTEGVSYQPLKCLTLETY